MLALEAQELYRFFHSGEEEVKALRGVDFSLAHGEMVALVGPSGSGKSTLLMCLSGLDEPDGGKVSIMNEPMSRKPEAVKASLRARYLGLMQQKNNLFSHLTVAENMAFAQGIARQQDAKKATGILIKFGIGERSGSLPGQLSGGEKARASLAAALAGGPRILLLDEPTGEVDAQSETAILSFLAEFCKEGGTVVAATHNESIARAASRVCTMRDGKLSNGR